MRVACGLIVKGVEPASGKTRERVHDFHRIIERARTMKRAKAMRHKTRTNEASPLGQ